MPGPRSSRRRTAHRSLQCVASVSVDTESLSTDNFWWKLGPEPVKFPRPALKRAFAVLLMRSVRAMCNHARAGAGLGGAACRRASLQT